MKRRKKLTVIVLILALAYIGWSRLYSFDIDKACTHAREQALSRSHCCCAWFTMRAMQSGGCPIGILPAWAYRYVLPFYKFHQLPEGTKPKKGDIVVIENSKEHIWGHIAILTDKGWVSDYKQRGMNPYRKHYPYRIFRYN